MEDKVIEITPRVAMAATTCCLHISMVANGLDELEQREFANIMLKKITRFKEDLEETP